MLVVGAPSYLEVEAIDTPASQTEGTDTEAAPVLDHWHKAHFGVATFESDATVFAALSARIEPTQKVLRIDFTPPQAGNYTLTVDLLATIGMYPVRARRFAVVQVRDAAPSTEGAKASSTTPAEALPRCVGLPDRGRWMRCSAPGLARPEECLRWGHIFRPGATHDDECFYENWRTEDLATYATTTEKKKEWIVVMGTSRLRGVFLSAADHLVVGKHGEFASITNCWGRMDVEMGNLRLTYQDYRALTVAPWPLRGPDEPRTFQCHADKQATFDGMEFFHNATQFMDNLFGDDDSQPPTAVVFETVDDVEPELYREMMFQHVPAAWQGVAMAIYFRSVINKNLDAPAWTPATKADWAQAIGWPDTAVVDVQDLVEPWMRSGQGGTGRMSQHWHVCTTDTTYPEVSFAVKGLVTDMLAQMVFNKVLGPKPPVDAPTSAPRPPVRVCTDCPGSLLPFNIKPLSNLTKCYDHVPLADYRKQYVPKVPECPEWCLREPVTQMLETQSGAVEVRKCTEQPQT